MYCPIPSSSAPKRLAFWFQLVVMSSHRPSHLLWLTMGPMSFNRPQIVLESHLPLLTCFRIDDLARAAPTAISLRLIAVEPFWMLTKSSNPPWRLTALDPPSTRSDLLCHFVSSARCFRYSVLLQAPCHIDPDTGAAVCEWPIACSRGRSETEPS